jgi:hypothetical protein
MRLVLRTIFVWQVVLVLLGDSLAAQNLKKVKDFKPGKIGNVSVDRLGNFFLVFKNGEVRKYDPNGKVLASLKNAKVPTLIDPWFHPKIFVYNQYNQQIAYYDRSFQNPEMEQLDPSIAIKPLLACPTSDNKLLVFDGADFSIKRVNPSSNQVVGEFYLDTLEAKPNFVSMREYQNLIFLLDSNSGIVIYNTIGKKVNQLKTDAKNFGFFGYQLYFLQDAKIVFFDLYTEKTRLEAVGEGVFVLVTDERILLVTKKGNVVLYDYHTKEDVDKP